MKTVYARASGAELLQVPLTSFDNEYQLTPLAAESWTQSEDGLTWTFKLRDGLVWSDGEPLTAEDYVFALQHAATSGYDFAWYWDFAGGIKNWKEVTEGKADASTLGLKAVDDKTIEITSTAPKPYMPSVVSLWYRFPSISSTSSAMTGRPMSRTSSPRASSPSSPGKSRTTPSSSPRTRPIPGHGRPKSTN